MDGNAHKIAEFAIQRIKLVPDYFALQFCHHKIGMGCSDFFKRERIVTPEILKASLFDGKQRGYIAGHKRSQLDLRIACRRDTVVDLVISVKQAVWRKSARQEYFAQPIVMHVVTRVVKVTHASRN